MPNETGFYWFYGDRYNDEKDTLELIFVTVSKIYGGSFIYVGNAEYMIESEFGKKWWFKKFEGIELPE